MDISRLLNDMAVEVRRPKRLRHSSLSPHDARHTISAVDRVPSEMWGEIFLYTIFADSEFDHWGNISHDSLYESDCCRPVLTGVCKTWRAIATDHAALWTFVMIFGGKPLDWAKLCLQRSKSLPVDIMLYEQGKYPNRDAWALEACSTIATQSIRLREFKVYLPDSALPQAFFSSLLSAPQVSVLLKDYQ